MVGDERAELAAEVVGVAHGAVPVANDGLGDEGSEVVLVVPAHTLDGDGDVGRALGVVPDPDLRSDELGLLLLLGDLLAGVAGGLGGERGKVLLGEVDELLVGNATGTNEHHAVGGVVGLDVVLQVGALDALDVLLGAEDGASERLSLEGGGVQVVENDLLELLVDLLLLAENDVALALDGLGVELGVLEDVGKDVDGLGHVVVEGLGVVDGVFALSNVHQHSKAQSLWVSYRSVGIQVAAHVLDLELELVLCALLGSLWPGISGCVTTRGAVRPPTLKARCSRKCAVPLVLSVSARLPASIHTPTVDVWAHGECSVAICGRGSMAVLAAVGAAYVR